MIKSFWKLLNVEYHERGRAGFLLAMSFFIGLFIACVTVASLTYFLEHFDERFQLPEAIAVSGLVSIFATVIYNVLQGRVKFLYLGTVSLTVVLLLTCLIEFADDLFPDLEEKTIHYAAFTLILSFTYICQLVFWGTFSRMFNVREGKRIIGSVDMGMDLSAILGYFSIPVLLNAGFEPRALYTVGLGSIFVYLALFILMARRYFRKEETHVEEAAIKKLPLKQFFSNRFILTMAVFVIVSLVTMNFVGFSFYNVSVTQFDQQSLPYFLSFFEGTIVVFAFIFTTFATDRIIKEYGLRIALLVTPTVLLIFTLAAIALGGYLGFDVTSSGKENVVYFFVAVAMCRLMVDSMTNAVDQPTFKCYYVPLDKNTSIDVKTKLEGTTMAIGSLLAGGLIVLINQFPFFNLFSMTIFIVPLAIIWIVAIRFMYRGYRHSLASSLTKNKMTVLSRASFREYSLEKILTGALQKKRDHCVIYNLKMMEKMEPSLFETAVLQLAESPVAAVREYARKKIESLQLDGSRNEFRILADQAETQSRQSDLLSVSSANLMKLSKSPKTADRALAAKLIVSSDHSRTIFTLLELLRDNAPEVRIEAIRTASKIGRSETWPLLIKQLALPVFSHLAARALKDIGEKTLPYLENAFHKSGQSDLLMEKIIQVIGSIGGTEAMELLWKKIDYPDKRIVQNTLHALRVLNIRATGGHVLQVKELLDVEMNNLLWNMMGIEEIPQTNHYEPLLSALREEVQENQRQITLLLSLLYDPAEVQLMKENLDIGTPDSIQYAVELLDIILDGDLKPKLIPLVDDTSVKVKQELLMSHFPRENYDSLEIVNYLLSRDYNHTNRWTKACALYSKATVPDNDPAVNLISHMFNPDRMLKELAAWGVFNKGKGVYENTIKRLPPEDRRFLDDVVHNNQLVEGLDDGYFMIVEIGMLLKQVPIFSGIPGNSIAYLADITTPVKLRGGEIREAPQESCIYITALGSVQLMQGNKSVWSLPRYAVYGDLFQIEETLAFDAMQAAEDSVVFQMETADFYFAMASHPELAQEILTALSGGNQEQREKPSAA